MSLEVVLGPMFAGKTSYALSAIRKHTALGQRVLVIKPTCDTRFGVTSEITTHDGDSLPCMTTNTLNSVTDDVFASCDVIVIDEAQFFTGLLYFVVAATEQKHKSVYVIGLSGDYQRRAFGEVLAVIPYADKVTKLSAICACGGEAHFTRRLNPNAGQVIIGGAESYEAVCRACFVG
uniref:thymidine kinase n=1 Tax=viral metagenome TaxID=1070528 RepID=A0A6C0JLU1_9ZZZZ